MKYIQSYKLFLESRISDGMDLFGDKIINKDLYDELIKHQNKEFQVQRELPRFITTNKYVDGRKQRFEIIWNQTTSHDIYTKIKDRHISVKSIEELIEKLKLMLSKLFPDMLDKFTEDGKYCIILNESKFLVIMVFNKSEYLRKNYKLDIKTIMSITAHEDVIDTINLDI